MSDVPPRPFPSLARIALALVLLAATAHGLAQNDTPPDPPGGPIAERMVPGAVIELPPGRFRLDTAPAVAGDLILRGAGRDATVLVAGGGEVVAVQSGTLTLENLTIEAPGTEPNNLVWLVDASFRLTNVRLEGADPVPADEDGVLGPGGNGVYAFNSVGTITSSQLIDNQHYAVFATNDSDVTLRDVAVQGGLHGIRISEEGARGTLERVAVDGVGGDGVYLAAGADVDVRDVDVRHSAGTGMLIEAGASVRIDGSTVADSGAGGIALKTEGTVVVSNTTSERNTLSGVLVEAGAPTLSDLVLNDNVEAGLVYFGATAGTASRITTDGNGLAGVAVLAEAAPALTDVTAVGNGGYGFRVDATANPTFAGTLVATDNASGASDREDLAARIAAAPGTAATGTAASGTAGDGEADAGLKDRIEAGGDVRLGPGLHVVDGDVVPYADLRLVGEGRGTTTLRVENLFDAGLDLSELDVTLQDLTLEVAVTSTPSEYPQAISANGGALIVRDAAIRVDGTAPGSLAGVVLYAGTLSMDDVEVTGFPYAGVYLESGIANLRSVTAVGNGNGIEVQTIASEGFAEIRDAELIGNTLAGLAVFDGASARLQGGLVAENEAEGVFVNGTGSVTLEGVRIADNPAFGIYADGGRVVATNIDFETNRNAVWALADANVTVERSTITGDTGFGVAGNGTGTTVLRDVTIRGSLYSNVAIEEQRSATLERVTSTQAGESGLIVRDDASVEVANSRFETNGNDSIAVEDAASVDVRSSVMNGNGRYGILLATTGAYALENVTYVGNSGGDLIEPDDLAAQAGPSRSDAGGAAPPAGTPTGPAPTTPDATTPDATLAPVGWTIDAGSGTPYAFAYGVQTSIGLGCGADGAPFAVLFVDGGPTQGRDDFRIDDGGQPIDLLTTGTDVHQLASAGSTFAAAEDLIFTARFEDEVTVHATIDGQRVPILAYRGGPAFQVVLDGLGCL